MNQQEPPVEVKTSSRPELEEKLEGKKKIAEQIKAKYAELYKELVNKLTTSHLEPFAKILLKHEKCTLRNQGELVESLREKLLKDLQRANERFWNEFNVVDGLVGIEMLKEKFKEFEGTDWKVQDKTTNQRTLPLRMCLKKAQMRTLQKQLQHQNAQLEEIVAVNKKKRDQVQEVFRLQTVLRVEMERCMQSFQQVKPELDRCIQKAFNAGGGRYDYNEESGAAE